MPLLLRESDVAALLEWPALIDLMQHTLADFSAGRVLQPVRTAIRVEELDVVHAVMPAVLPAQGAAGLKLVTLAPGNAQRGLPTHLATVLLAEADTGRLLAILDGRLITERRTAAVSAAATRALARPGAATLALVGSGVQAASHLEAFRHVRRIAHVRVWSHTAAHAERFAREWAGRTGLDVRACATAQQAVRDAELVVTATSSRAAVVRGAWLAPGAHVTAVGACLADRRELDAEAVARARVFVDSLAAARVEAGDLVQAAGEGAWTFDSVAGELGALFGGGVAGRERDDQVTLFKSLGLACEDVATARWLADRARERGKGREVEL